MTWRRGLGLLVLMLVAVSCATVDRNEDLRIESEVKARLVAETDANLTRLGVVSTGGVVRLSGTVADAEQRARATEVAKSVRGVRRVVNTLEIASTR